MLLITRLVLRFFLDESMHSRHPIINTEMRSLTDLFVILEKVLWHGFKSSGSGIFHTLPQISVKCIAKQGVTQGSADKVLC